VHDSNHHPELEPNRDDETGTTLPLAAADWLLVITIGQSSDGSLLRMLTARRRHSNYNSVWSPRSTRVRM